MMLKREILYIVALLSLFSHPDCYGATSEQLPQLHPNSSFYQKQRSITCKVQALSARESGMLFGTNIIKKGFRPLILAIENHGLRSYLLPAHDIQYQAPSQIMLDLVSADIIIKALSLNTSGFLMAGASAAYYFNWSMLVPAGLIGYGFYRFNKRVRSLINDNILEQTLEIGPLKTIKRLFFIAENKFSAQFSITLYDQVAEDSFTFDVDLLKGPHIRGLTLE